ncbi:hypothetical protein [Halobellus limi]|uniref:BREX system P-loop protein BrxC n=1 Tax=Halobellus limi TaxID=699433 RepID=A0A1H6ANW3_9EURY|nr:hypothetical protein [Halobellus limi]QCC47680.1 hypothetical protein DV707_08420 [Halobellus limi]SEG50419.1 hypothetical protein SAMN04488133_2427 [Halobellus limi]
MTGEDWFSADVGSDFEESVRIDREDDERDHRLESIDTYHVTGEAEDFLTDFFARLLGRSEDMRSGANYWLYGYYGSGKSHLLSVLRGLMDTEWLQQQDAVWSELADGRDLGGLEATWTAIHDEYEVIPVSVNLLKYQGQKERSFSEIVLRAAHTSERLTGVEGGLSPQQDVAYFEDWYRTTDAWPERTEHARTALEGTIDSPERYEWLDIQQYRALADAVLPTLIEKETGTADGLDDLTPSDLDPEAMVGRLEELRSEREAESDRPVKLVLLLDEVSLFIGTDFDRLTELQTLAENIDEIGDGDIQMVATAQAKIEDVQPMFAARGADFSIVKDRFPHRFGLPSRHVGEIATQRLLKKTEAGRGETERILRETSNEPEALLVFTGIEQNTEPPLDDIDRELLIDFYPFLPYQPALFLEILSNLRQEANDPAKSIFSGTARAILALVHGLLQEWMEEDVHEETHVVSLVDFYDLIEPELDDITPRDVEVVEEIEEQFNEGKLEATDVDVAKAVLLLQHVPDTIPMTERNLGVAVLSDLDGPTQFQMENRVEESLQRLRKFIRPSHDEVGPRYTFANQEEREIYEETETNLETPEWDAILEAVDQYLWEDIARDLSLPTSAEYGDTGEQYPVRYEFSIDGVELESTIDADDALDVTIAVEGLSPDGAPSSPADDPLEWTIGGEGLNDLRDSLIEWWSLRAAVGDHTLPQSVERDLSERASRARSKIVEALKSGTFAVKDRTDIHGVTTAVGKYVGVRYPDDFHPVMLQIGKEHLQELRGLSAQDPLPNWARQIEVATEVPETHGGSIQNNVRAFTGQQLKQSGGTLAMATILDGIVDRKAIYEGARPALCAIIWGLCRKGDFLPVDETGDSVELDAVIDLDELTTTRLKIASGDGVRSALEKGGYIDTTETVPDGIVRLQGANEALESRLSSLKEDVELVADSDVQTQPVRGLLESFAETLERERREASERREAVKSGDTDWAETVENTSAAQEWYEDAKEVWDLRLPALAKLDTLLVLAEQPFGWLTDDCETASQALRDGIEAFDGEWWTHDGWDRFNDARTVSPSLEDTIEDSWETFENSGIATLVDELRAHPWLRPATEFESNVRPAFENEYLTPLRRVTRWYDGLSEAVALVTGGTTDSEADDFVRATNTLVDREPLDAIATDDVTALQATFEDLCSIVGDREPSGVTAIGLLPADRDSVESELERLAERHELSIERTEAGVIIR